LSLIADPTQLDKDTLERFVTEIVGLLRKRGGMGPRRAVDRWGFLFCKCPAPVPLNIARISEEGVRKKMVELLAPLVAADFQVWAEYRLEPEAH